MSDPNEEHEVFLKWLCVLLAHANKQHNFFSAVFFPVWLEINNTALVEHAQAFIVRFGAPLLFDARCNTNAICVKLNFVVVVYQFLFFLRNTQSRRKCFVFFSLLFFNDESNIKREKTQFVVWFPFASKREHITLEDRIELIFFSFVTCICRVSWIQQDLFLLCLYLHLVMDDM